MRPYAGGPRERDADETAAIANSDRLVAELLDADTVVIATGLINFNIYSTSKSWIDNELGVVVDVE